MNAAHVTRKAAPEEPAVLPDTIGRFEGDGSAGAEGDTDAEHVRAVWALAALTALDGIRHEPSPQAVDASGTAAAQPPAPGDDESYIPGAAPAASATGPGPVPGDERAPDVPQPADAPEAAAADGTDAADGSDAVAAEEPGTEHRVPSGGDPQNRLSPTKGAARRGGDPVKALIHRHRELCEQAVDPLEIAAGLEAHGLTDRTAARFRHRDVFSLAEEMFARAERATPTDDRPARAADPRAGRALLHPRTVLPGAVCVLTVVVASATEGGARLAACGLGALLTTLALMRALRRGPLRASGRSRPALRLWTLWLLAYAACGQGLLGEIIDGGPDTLWPLDPAPFVALALAVVPAAWCAHLFAVRTRRRLDTSRGLEEFAAGTRPLLLAVLLLYAASVGALVALTGLVMPGSEALAAAAVLGILLFLARLLVVHGFPEPASAALAAACAVEVAAPALLLSGRLPGLGPIARPVELLVTSWGVAAVPVLACGTAAAGLLVHAFVVLPRASAHTH